MQNGSIEPCRTSRYAAASRVPPDKVASASATVTGSSLRPRGMAPRFPPLFFYFGLPRASAPRQGA
jgi:hypothetical protein